MAQTHIPAAGGRQRDGTPSEYRGGVGVTRVSVDGQVRSVGGGRGQVPCTDEAVIGKFIPPLW